MTSSEFTKRVVRNCPTKNVDNQVPSHIFLSLLNFKFKCKIPFLYSFEYICCLNSWKKKFKKPSANFEAFRHSFYWSISFIESRNGSHILQVRLLNFIKISAPLCCIPGKENESNLSFFYDELLSVSPK